MAGDNDAGTVAQSNVIASTHLGSAPTATDEPTPSCLPRQPDPADRQESVTPTASKLSPRLTLLADWATAGTLPADAVEQDRMLSLAESGAGSLARDAAGNPVVEVRVADTSPETLAALTALPADVLSISPEYATVTLAIAPEHLNELASLDAVQYVGEVIQPERRSPDGPRGGGIAPSAP
jgi:hypothetical protein